METTSHTPAGALNADFEFFEKDGEIYFLHRGKTHEFKEIDVRYLDMLLVDLERHPRAIKAMEDTGILDPVAQLKQWAICNFGEFDLISDLTEGGVIAHEHIHCSKRGNCKFEGLICDPLPLLDGMITPREMQIIKLIALDLLDKQIADMLGISVATISVHRTHIEHKIGCHSKAGVTAFAYQNNIL